MERCTRCASRGEESGYRPTRLSSCIAQENFQSTNPLPSVCACGIVSANGSQAKRVLLSDALSRGFELLRGNNLLAIQLVEW